MKIQATELRIGNWILDDENKPSQICCLQSDFYYNESGIDERPILFLRGDLIMYSVGEISGTPLTPELLEKCGCSKYEQGYYNLTDDTIISIDNHVYFVNNNNSKHCLCECIYLHQLQNLYWCLVGQELQINL